MSIPVIHQTDLFRPHNDPDDHWDAACVYALAHAGDIDLKGIVIDYPPVEHSGDPDILGLAQMNYITGQSVPFAIGSAKPLTPSGADPALPSHGDGEAANMIITILENSSDPVAITIAGSCRDTAIAASRAPGLFRERCAAIYLNAGTGGRSVDPDAELEYNVRVDPIAFQAVFDIPCPIYWIPCFEVITNQIQVCEYGSWYDFRQADILPYLGRKTQKYFLYMFSQSDDVNWLRYLHEEKDRELLPEYALMSRNMWCTAGIFDSAGKCVNSRGEIKKRAYAGDDRVFGFDPIELHCDKTGVTTWSPASKGTNRYIFHVRDVNNYRKAMTKAMKSLLATLP